jgi:hypothetical protein
MRSPVTVIKDLLIVAALAMAVTFGHAVRGYSQEKPDPGDKENTITLKIVKDDNGKVTVIDTTITTKGKEKTLQYEYTLRSMDKQMAEMEHQLQEMENQMKHYEVEVRMGDELENMDSVIRIGDSIEKHIIIRGMGPECDRPCPPAEMEMWFGDDEGFRHMDFDNEDFEFPEFPMPPQWEALLQSIPKGTIKGFQIKDRKDGKRIIIDVDDDAPVMIMAPYRHHGGNRVEKRVIIRGDADDLQIPPPPPPPPPPAEEKDKTPKPNKG